MLVPSNSLANVEKCFKVPKIPVSECELACPPSGHVTAPVNNLHYFCCRKYSPSTESAGSRGGGLSSSGNGKYLSDKIKITTKSFNFIAKNTLTIS